MYKVNIKDNKGVELNPYSFDLMDKVEEIKGIKGMRDRCTAMYDFLSKAIKDDITEIIGDLENADPNDIIVAYSDVVECYTAPQQEAMTKEMQKRLATINSLKLGDIAKSINSLSGLKNTL